MKQTLTWSWGAVRLLWPASLYVAWMVVYAVSIEQFIPASIREIVAIALPVPVAVVAYLKANWWGYLGIGLICIYKGSSAILTLWESAAGLISTGRYSVWQLAGSFYYFMPATVATFTLILGVLLVICMVPAVRARLKRKIADLISKATDAHARQSDSKFFGASRFKTKKEILKMAEGGPGMVFGQIAPDPKKDLVTAPLEGHAIICAPTGTGKGTHFINTNLLVPTEKCSSGPVVILDPQGESFFITAKRRSQLVNKKGKRRKVRLLDAFGTIQARAIESARRGRHDIYSQPTDYYNPMDFIRRDEFMSADIKSLMQGLVLEPKDGGKNKHFYTGARRLIGGAIAYVLATMPKKDHNLGYVYDLIARSHEEVEHLLQDMVKRTDLAFGFPAKSASLILNMGAQERGSMYSTATNALEFLDTPQFREMISQSTFSMDDITHDECDVFLVIPPDMMDDGAPLMRMMVSILLAQAQRPNGKPVDRVTVIVDEAPLIGRLDPIIRAFRVARKINLSFVVITQTLFDFESEYGKTDMQALIANAEYVSFFGISNGDLETPDMLEKLMGSTTWWKESTGESSGSSAKAVDLMGTNSANQNTNYSLEKRALMLASEIREMPGDEVIVLSRRRETKGVMKVHQSHYYAREDCKRYAGENPYFGEGSIDKAAPTTASKRDADDFDHDDMAA